MPVAGTNSTWQATVVAVAILAMITIIMVAALSKLKLEGVLKLWTALGPMTGLVTGAMATYFFANHQIQVAQDAATVAHDKVDSISAKSQQVEDLATQIGLQKLAQLPPEKASTVLAAANLPHAATQPGAWMTNVRKFNALNAEIRSTAK